MLYPILPRRLGWTRSDRPILTRQISILNTEFQQRFYNPQPRQPSPHKRLICQGLSRIARSSGYKTLTSALLALETIRIIS